MQRGAYSKLEHIAYALRPGQRQRVRKKKCAMILCDNDVGERQRKYCSPCSAEVLLSGLKKRKRKKKSSPS